MEVAQFQPIAPPPCTQECCGGRAFSPIDYSFFFFEIISGVGAIVTAAQEDYAACGVSTGAFLCFGIGHCLVRKYGHTAVIIQRFNRAQQAYTRTIGEHAQRIGQLDSAVADLEAANLAFTGERKELAAENRRFALQIDSQREAQEKMEAALQALEKANETLTEKNIALEKLNASLTERIRDFARQNAAFEEEIQSIARTIPALESAAAALAPSADSFDSAVDDLGLQVGRSQSLVRRIIEILQKNEQDLSLQLMALEEEKGKLSDEVIQLREQRLRFEAAARRAEETIIRLREVQDRLGDGASGLTSGASALAQETDDLRALFKELQDRKDDDGDKR